MADAELPSFRYHPDPVATGAVERLGGTCRVCERERGWLYTYMPYAAEDLHEAVCPWCIADGSAFARFAATFNDVADQVPEGVPATVAEELIRRTPGFAAWQHERWLFHHDDACAFLGAVGWLELRDHPDALDAIRDQVRDWGWPDEQVEVFVEALDADGSPTAYLFRCLTCGQHLAYADMD